MAWVWYIVLLALQVAGLVLNLFGLPGLWLMVIAAGLYSWVTWEDRYLKIYALVVIVLLALAAEVVEFVAGSAGAKKAGASKLGMFAAMVGGIVGAIAGTPLIPVPIVGTILGAVVGSAAATMFVEWFKRGEVNHVLRTGWGAGKGRLLGILGKSALGAAMLVVTIVLALPVSTARPIVIVPAAPPTPLLNPPATQGSTLPATTPAMFPATLP